ncbi:hypothetical protein DRQ29_07565 [bacterium]|nr:PASTA domain-containing protein [bacterium]RKZ24678.1 MAG: hypothetical protein DRQ29_07565 [bacterium]
MWEKLRNIIIYLLLLGIGVFAGFWVFDRVLMPVVIGSGKAYPIPNLVGLPTDDAEQIVASQEFRFKIIREEYSTTVPANRILNQIPNAESLAKKGRTIRVVISKGGIKAIVPDVVGELFRQAKIAIEDARLTVAEIETVFNDSIGKNKIISTEPACGETLAAGAGVKLIVSLGAETGTVAVPNLVGMNADEACKTINRLGLKWKKVKRRIPTIANDVVFKQEPRPGTLLYRGNAVTIMVNSLE